MMFNIMTFNSPELRNSEKIILEIFFFFKLNNISLQLSAKE